MAKLIYPMPTSLDGYTEDAHDHFGWGVPEDEEVHSHVNELASSLGTYLYGRRMCETMVYRETAHTIPDHPQFVLDWGRQWRATEKIVYSRTLADPAAPGRESNGCSIPTRSGGSSPTSSATSVLTVLNLLRRRYGRDLSTSSR